MTVPNLTGRRCSVGTSAAEDSRERLEQDSQVATQGEVLHVVELDGKPLRKAQRPTPEDLHRPRDPRLHGKPEAVLGAVAADELDLLGPWADDAHVTLQ